jgi:hypothetical protein
MGASAPIFLGEIQTRDSTSERQPESSSSAARDRTSNESSHRLELISGNASKLLKSVIPRVGGVSRILVTGCRIEKLDVMRPFFDERTSRAWILACARMTNFARGQIPPTSSQSPAESPPNLHSTPQSTPSSTHRHPSKRQAQRQCAKVQASATRQFVY